MITKPSTTLVATTTPPTPWPDPGHKPEEPTTPGPPEPDEIPFTEPKHYPIHPEIPVQPIHEREPATCAGFGCTRGSPIAASVFVISSREMSRGC